MNFVETLPRIIAEFDASNLRFALIGGLAMAMRGVQRATLDADFILLADNLVAAHAILTKIGYQQDYHSQNVSHYVSADPALGRIDLLHAFREATLGMLERAERLHFSGDQTIPVVQIEDLIGLKVQASVNDPSRYRRDWNDIHMLLEHSARQRLPLDWELVGDYLDLFDLSEKLPELQAIHGSPQSI